MYYLFRFGYLGVYCLHVRFYVFTKEEEKAESRSFYFLFFILKIPENFLSSWGWSFLIFWLLYVLYIYSFMSTYARQDQLIKPAILCVCVRQLWDNWKSDVIAVSLLDCASKQLVGETTMIELDINNRVGSTLSSTKRPAILSVVPILAVLWFSFQCTLVFVKLLSFLSQCLPRSFYVLLCFYQILLLCDCLRVLCFQQMARLSVEENGWDLPDELKNQRILLIQM